MFKFILNSFKLYPNIPMLDPQVQYVVEPQTDASDGAKGHA